MYFAFALVTYLVLFVKYLQSRRNNIQRNPADNVRISPWKAFVGSRFFISVLLIGSYLLLTSVPSLVRTALGWTTTDSSGNLSYEVLSRLSYTVDAIIYIYVSKPVRNILLTRLRKIGLVKKGSIRIQPTERVNETNIETPTITTKTTKTTQLCNCGRVQCRCKT